jgi:putative MATE family efflux protein
MVGQLGEQSIAAVGLANQLYFLFNLLLFGIVSGSSILLAQFWGKRDLINLRKVQGIALITSVAGAVIFSLIALLLPEAFMSIYSSDPVVIDLGSQFLRISALSYIFTSVTFCYSFTSRATGEAKIPLFSSIIAIAINIILNYIFIFGKLGLEPMGVRGSATGTLVARIVEIIVILSLTYRLKLPGASSLKELTSAGRDFTVRMYKTIAPVILNEFLWALGITMYTVAYGRIGTNAVAAVNIATVIEKISMVLFIGMANAGAVIVGNRIGANEEERAYYYSKKLLIAGPAIGVIMGSLLAFVAPNILSLYKVSQEVTSTSIHLLFSIGFLTPLRVFNNILIVGVLRGGGDTKYTLVVDALSVWLVGVPLAFIGATVIKLPVLTVYLLVATEEVVKFILGLQRFLSKKWINNLVIHEN